MYIMCTTSLSKQRGSTLSHLHAKSLYVSILQENQSEFNLIGMFYVLNKFSFFQSTTKNEQDIDVGLYHPLSPTFLCSIVGEQK